MVFFFNRDDLLQILGISTTNVPTQIFEIVDILIMSVAIAYIFEAFFHVRRNNLPENYDPLTEYRKSRFHLNKESFLISLYAIAPAIILHELLHKFVAIMLGSAATFYASYGGLALGIILRLVGSPFIFFVPGFVVHAAGAAAWQGALIASAGPFANLVLWIGSRYLLREQKQYRWRAKTITILTISKKVNLFLFLFNMIPIPPFDGGNVVLNLIRMIW